MTQLLLFPCNGNAQEALDCLSDGFDCIGFVDDDPQKHGSTVLGLPVLGRDALVRYPEAKVLAVPGSPVSYPERASQIASLGLQPQRFASVVHPNAVVGKSVLLGCNVLVMAGVCLMANAKIGSHVVLLPNTVIHHDSSIGNYSLVGAGVLVAGFVRIGQNCYIGSGSSFRNNLSVADGSLIGMGSNVVKPIDQAWRVWAGNPARPVRSLSAHSDGSSAT